MVRMAQVGRGNAVLRDECIAPAVFELPVQPFETSLPGGNLRTVLPEQFKREQRQIEIVLIIPLVDHFRPPGLHHRIGDQPVAVPEFGGDAPPYAGHLSQPSRTDLVGVFGQCYTPLPDSALRRQERRQREKPSQGRVHTFSSPPLRRVISLYRRPHLARPHWPPQWD